MTKLSAPVLAALLLAAPAITVATALPVRADALVAGASYSTVYGATVQGDLTFSDILSSGVDLKIEHREGDEGRGSLIDARRSWGFGRTILGDATTLELGLNGYQRDWDFLSYKRKSYGLTLGVDAYLTRHLSYNAGLFAQQDDLSAHDSASTSDLILQDMGSSHSAGLDLGVTWSNRAPGETFAPGVTLNAGMRASGLGNAREFNQWQFSADSFLPAFRDTVLNLGISGGTVKSSSDDYVSITDRAMLGGEAMRGFVFDGIGPRDPTTGDALGGTRYIAATAELFIPTAQEGLWLGAFYDVGSLWHLPGINDPTVDDSLHWRESLGLSLSYETRFGRVSGALAAPITKREEDEVQNVSLSLSARF